MDTTSNENMATELMSTLPGDDVRQIMWRFADRYELQMIVQSARSLARGVVARLVAEGARNTHEWTEKKAQLLTGFDEVGLTTVFMDPEDGGFLAGPKNLALALVAFELSWVDGGAATCSLASNLAWGEDGSVLYVTAGDRLFRVETRTRGAGIAGAR